jgi:hypothetical protein
MPLETSFTEVTKVCKLRLAIYFFQQKSPKYLSGIYVQIATFGECWRCILHFWLGLAGLFSAKWHLKQVRKKFMPILKSILWKNVFGIDI